MTAFYFLPYYVNISLLFTLSDALFEENKLENAGIKGE